jgi:glutathione S-transferase
MEKTLARRLWLVGEAFSLADIAMAPYVNRLDMLGMDLANFGRQSWPSMELLLQPA